MNADELKAVGKRLDALCDLYGKPPLSDDTRALYFAVVMKYPANAVLAAISAHVEDEKRGQFMPKPADIVAGIRGLQALDGRPGTEEAWAIAVAAQDEYLTAVVTDEISEAMGAARPLFHDKVAARKAFQEVYERLVEQNRKQGLRIHWNVQLGYDKKHQEQAIKQAVSDGKLQAEQVRHLLPVAPANVYGLLADMSQSVELDADRRQKALEMLDGLKRIISQPTAREIEEEQERRIAREVEAQRRELLLRQANGKAA